MKNLAILTTALLSATPAFANYGDVDMQIEAAQQEAVTLTVALVAPTNATADGICKLSQEHLVQVPADFTPAATITVACLDQ